MDSSKVWLLLVDHNFRVIGDMFSVRTSDTDNIYDLKEKVKEAWKIGLARVDAARLTVWKTKGAMFNTLSHKRLEEVLGLIDIDDPEFIEELKVDCLVASLDLATSQTLLVQLPDLALGHPLGHMGREYDGFFLQAYTKGELTEDDLELNRIDDVHWHSHIPEFVKRHHQMLGRKRKPADDMRAAAEMLVGEATAKEYFDYSTANDSVPTADRLELNHIAYLSIVNKEWWEYRPFDETDANHLFFYTIAHHLKSLPSNTESAKISVQLGQGSWPFLLNLIILVEKDYYKYRPKSDLLIAKFGLPRAAVVVDSPDRPEGQYRLMLQGASIVRFANTFLDAYKKEKNFIFVAIFVTSIGQIVRYLVYQDEGYQSVSYSQQHFDCAKEDDRARFALELYNLSSALDDESENGDTCEKVRKLADSVSKLAKEHDLPTFTGKIKFSISVDEGNQSGFDVRREGEDGDANEQLKAWGYEVVPDVFETDHGTWELISKPPPHIRTVYRRNDPNKTEMIAKHVRVRSNELGILEYLRTIRPQSQHIISFIEVIPPTSREWLILPMLCACDSVLLNSGGVRGRVQLGWGLVKGLAYLHQHKVAHRDIKPSNLVTDTDLRLRLIDFDLAIKVQDENTEIDEYCGTKYWTAPEMGEQDGPTPMYSPIKADRWSCGRVILRYIIGNRDKRLSKFASELMANDPQQRPSLLEWHKWFAGPPPGAANVLKDGRKEMSEHKQDTMEDDEESSTRPTDAKKPRLA